MRIAGRRKCASTPHVVCAFRHGSKSGAGYRPKQLRRTATLARRYRRNPVGCQVRLPRRNGGFRGGSNRSGQAGNPNGGSANPSDDPRLALRHRWRSSFNGSAAPLPSETNLLCIVNGAPDGGPAPGAPARRRSGWRRPRPPPCGRPAHQIRQRQACRERLGVPLGTLRFLHPNGASSARGAPLPLGVRGGTAPRQPPPGTREAWPQGVCWLPRLSGPDPAQRTTSVTPRRASP